MLDNEPYLKSKIQFFIPEIIIFCLYFSVYCWASVTNHRFILGGLILGVLSFIFFVAEHRTDLILDKINNIVIIRGKMLFINRYIIKQQYSLADMSCADVAAFTQYYREDKTTTTTTTYKLRIFNKDNSFYYPFKSWSGYNKQKWRNMADKINSFVTSDERILIISRKPFILRYCFGIVLGLIYFLAGLNIIFPKELIFYQTSNFLLNIFNQ